MTWLVRGAPLLLALALSGGCAQYLPHVTPPYEDAPNDIHLLVIGNQNYSPLSSLNNPLNDKDVVCEVLKRRLAGRVTARCYGDLATKADFEDAVKKLTANLTSRSAVIFYYSGHGVQLNDQNYLVPTGVAQPKDLRDLERSFFDMSTLFAAIRPSNPLFSMFVLDACRTDPFRDARKPAEGDVADKKSVAVAKDILPGLTSKRSSFAAEAPPGSLILYATSKGEVAYDPQERKLGLLTEHFVWHLNNGGDLPVQRLADKIGETLAADNDGGSKPLQQPWVYHSFFSERFCFDRRCREAFFVPPTF